MNLLKEIKENNLVELFLNGNFGLEKEGLRVVLPADLAMTNHPKSLGNNELHPYIQNDYGEAMPELITPPLSPYSKALNYLQTLHYVLVNNLAADEYIWPFSVPCKTPEVDEDLKIAQTTNVELNQYRLYTASKYGRKRQHINGIHINYSFNDDFLAELFDIQDEFTVFEKFRDELYLKFASNFLRYQWLIVYLFGASPIAEDNFFECPFFDDEELPTEPMRSLRNSQYGFINRPEIGARYDSIENYTQDLAKAVESGLLKEVREFYGDIRLRGFTESSITGFENGIQYVEIRSFDNNPYQPAGIDAETLQFVHLYFLTMVSMNDKVSSEQTEKGKKLKRTVAEEYPLSKTIQYDEGIWLLGEMKRVIEILELEESYSKVVDRAFDRLNHPERTIAGKITKDIEAGVSLLILGEKIGWNHKLNTIGKQELPGFEYLPFAKQKELYKIVQNGLDLPRNIFEKSP